MTNLLMEGTYRGFKLDPFQLEAIEHIEAGLSVLVSAPTGVGKTLIADYLIEKTYREGKQVVYTAPIKALSNQKFKEFKRLLGEDQVGILTGDVVINQDAPVMIMTTEIFRNLLHLDPGRLAHVAYVIFDEIHYIDDPERGSVWEESLIFMPSTMRFLGLSATIPNVDELAAWIGQIHQQEIKIVRHHQRAVPLEHRLFEINRALHPKQLAIHWRHAKSSSRPPIWTYWITSVLVTSPAFSSCSAVANVSREPGNWGRSKTSSITGRRRKSERWSTK